MLFILLERFNICCRTKSISKPKENPLCFESNYSKNGSFYSDLQKIQFYKSFIDIDSKLFSCLTIPKLLDFFSISIYLKNSTVHFRFDFKTIRYTANTDK